MMLATIARTLRHSNCNLYKLGTVESGDWPVMAALRNSAVPNRRPKDTQNVTMRGLLVTIL